MSNHRPTLESKRGKRIAIENLIQHARNQPQHQTLKRRHVSDDEDEEIDSLSQESHQQRVKGGGLLVVDNYGTSSDEDDDEVDSETESKRDQPEAGLASDGVLSADEGEEEDEGSSLDDDEELIRSELARTQSERREVVAASPTTTKKLSWRSTPFKKAKTTTSIDGDDFHTSLIDTKRHRDFMAKYIR